MILNRHYNIIMSSKVSFDQNWNPFIVVIAENKT